MIQFLNNIATWLESALRPASAVLIALYVAVIAVIVVYGLHRYWLVYLYSRAGGARTLQRNTPEAIRGRITLGPNGAARAELPFVTIQLPMFNERAVARRVIESSCRLDYPRDRLEIQVLDDSTDDSAHIARTTADDMRRLGHDIHYLHRTHREGFKAGALADGLNTARGELIAVFDADFVPPPDMLLNTVGHFLHDPNVGMVQVRWGHLNRDDSWLTRSQAVFLDGHFIIEHTARERAGRWFNFNGTGGVWRRACISDAGGWQHDTLTEDVDLSYRAQLRGWKFVYDPSIECPGELPPCVSAFNSQQHRWTKGSIQTGLKLLPTILRSDAPLAVKLEAWFHLTAPCVHILVVLLSLLCIPAFFVTISPVRAGTTSALIFGLTLCALLTASGGSFYVASQAAQGRGVWRTIAKLPLLMAVGIGISVNNSRAVIEALLGLRSPFVRTPKYNGGKHATLDPLARASSRRNEKHTDGARSRRWFSHFPWPPAGSIETALGLLMLAAAILAAADHRSLLSVPFLLLFAAGYLAIGLGSIRDSLAAPA